MAPPPPLRKVAIAQAQSDAQSVHRMIEDLARALTGLGHETIPFDSRSPANWAALAGQGVGSVICYGGGIGYALECVASLRGLNAILVSLDHPVYWVDSFKEFRAQHVGPAAFTFPTRSNLSFARHYIGEVPLHCLRHSAHAQPTIPLEQRPDGILLVGNFTPVSQARNDVDAQAPALLAGFDMAVDRLQSDRSLTLEQAVLPLFGDPREKDRSAFIWLCIQVDRHMRSWSRKRAVDALAGHPVTLVGGGWDTIDLPRSVNYVGRRDSSDVLNLIGAAKILVNTTPSYYESHERLFDAAACGTAIVTAKTAYSSALFARMGALYDDETEIGGLCAELLSTPETAAAIGQAGKDLIETSEGWPHRAIELAALLTPDQSDAAALLRRGFDYRIDLRGVAGELNLSVSALSAASDILIAVTAEHLQTALTLIAQTGRYISSGARISLIADGQIAQSALVQIAHLLAANGYQPLEAATAQTYCGITVRKP